MMIRKTIFLALATWLFPARFNASLDTQRVAQIAPAILRVDADGCGSVSRTGTGFIWRSADLVVTAWHLVSDCETIQVHSGTTRNSYPARIQAVLLSRDLALLRLSTPLPRIYNLQPAAAAPDLNEDLVVLGYPENVPSMSSKSFHAAYGGRTLREAIPNNVTRDLQTSGFLSPDTNILNIDGHLLPGHSGAPILNSAGEVVAIADGGLAGGTVGISWALPVGYLTELLNSHDLPSHAQRKGSANLFAFEFQAQKSAVSGPQYNCGGYMFRLVRKIGFGELLPFADDPTGLLQLLSGTGADFAPFMFDVYQEPISGASFVLPDGAILQSQVDSCLVSSNSTRVWFLIAMGKYQNQFQIESLVGQYEQRAMYYPPWQYDAAWSYPNPVNRFDGFGVRRKSFVHTAMAPNGFIYADARTFETLATRNGTLLMVSSLNRQWNPDLVAQGHQACIYAPGSPLCVQYLEWASAVISVHLATFPIG